MSCYQFNGHNWNKRFGWQFHYSSLPRCVCVQCIVFICCWFAYRISYSKWPEIRLNFSVNWIILQNRLSFNLGQNWKYHAICFIHLANGIISLYCLLCSASNCVINAERHKTIYGLLVIVLWIWMNGSKMKYVSSTEIWMTALKSFATIKYIEMKLL